LLGITGVLHGEFFGVISDGGPIFWLALNDPYYGAEGVDNVAFGDPGEGGQIPEPSTFGLLGAGLALLGLAWRRLR